MTLGGTASDVTIWRIGHGLMMMTWGRPDIVCDDDAFDAIKSGIDALPPGMKMMLNSGEFYGPQLSIANVELLARFFEKYPEYADRTFLSVKGGFRYRSLEVDSSPDNLKRSIDAINAALRGTKRLDLFQSARVDSNIPIEEVVRTLAGYVKDGLFDHIGLSECSAETLRRAHTVHPIAVVEIEISPWTYEEETKKVIATAQELGVTIAAYSPLGRGFLTGIIKSPSDLADGDMRQSMTRYNDENFAHNFMLVDALKVIANKKGVTPAQLCIAWVCSLGTHIAPIPGSSNKKRTLENLAAGDVGLTTDEKASIDAVIAGHEVKGDRYFGDPNAHIWG
ncbi:Pyridoxal reductase [Sparassis crispa]|uniref:Pyridoxal reductase n=1 Tax=Sparassis crispa TaxID=139825 RepID=A0A401H4Y2_9APHY|nr:Pyridoxal reductase [Sparassis crispa]GBE89488.1 Pyridoxal reductase [Sparassis crispa]